MNDDRQPQATKALVVLAVGLAGRWRLPLYYGWNECTAATLCTKDHHQQAMAVLLLCS